MKPTAFFKNLFLGVFELRASHLLGRNSYSLSLAISPNPTAFSSPSLLLCCKDSNVFLSRELAFPFFHKGVPKSKPYRTACKNCLHNLSIVTIE
jgi:hypothetical protein